MSELGTLFDEFSGILFVQPDGPGTTIYPLLCVDVGDIAMPQGGVSSQYRRTGTGSYVVRHRTKGTKGDVTFDIVTDLPKVAGALQKMAASGLDCPASFYMIHQNCPGRVDNILNYEVAQVFAHTYTTNVTQGNSGRGRATSDDQPAMVTQTYSVSAAPPAPWVYRLVGTISAAPSTGAAEDEPFRAIAIHGAAACYISGCGAGADLCDDLMIAGDAAAAADADGYHSEDKAASWAAWAAQPFAVAEDICALVSIEVMRGTKRLIALRGTTDAGNPAEIGYSDDDGATWTNVNVGATNGEFGNHSGAMFALDPDHVWIGTNLGNVYFSGDKGVTWTDQNAPAPGVSEGLYGVHFADEHHGWAVGGFRATPTCFLLQTVDGGQHWNLADSEPQVELAIDVRLVDASTLYVVMDDGTLWRSTSWGATGSWEQVAFDIATPTNLGCIDLWSDHMFAVGGYINKTDDYPLVLRTFNGGETWEAFEYPTPFDSAIAYFGINDLVMCDPNTILAVGEDIDALSLVWLLKPAGW